MAQNKYYENEWAVMKGIAITAVVLGHCCYYPFTEQFVNQWHLAVFFFVSGYFLKVENIVSLYDVKKEIIRKVKRLYVPFVFASGICLMFHNLLANLHIYETHLTLAQTGKDLVALVFGMTSREPLMGAMWFCPALLIVATIQMLMFYTLNNSISNWEKVLLKQNGGDCIDYQYVAKIQNYNNQYNMHYISRFYRMYSSLCTSPKKPAVHLAVHNN